MERERRRKKQVALLCLGAALGVTGLIFWFVGRPMLQFVSQPEVEAADGVTAKKIQNVYVYCQYITRTA